MTFTQHDARFGLTLVLALAVAACSNEQGPRLHAVPVQATDAREVETIATLLDQGDHRTAKKRLNAALKRDPGNPGLMLLRDSMAGNAKDMLGPSNFAYTVQAGETIGALAQRFLGNRLKSHQLARYNDIEGVATLAAGQVLRIPGQPPRVEPVRRPEKRADPQPAAPRPRAASTARPAVANSTSVARPRNDAETARRARFAGLAALNEGNPTRAVSLLSRAAALDPGNPAITRDLLRAQRISATVKARQ
jgi:LysM repeat protein